MSDPREALVALIEDRAVWLISRAQVNSRDIADAILAEFDVTPRGERETVEGCPMCWDLSGAICSACGRGLDDAPTERPSVVEQALRDQFEYRLRTAAAYFRARGKFGEAPEEGFIESQRDAAVKSVLALLPGRAEGEVYREGYDKGLRDAAAVSRSEAEVKAEAWDEGERHESEYLTTFGQFCPHGPQCNPYRKEQS